MFDYYLKVKKDNLFYISAHLKADNRDDAIKQSNEIMNRFPEPEFTAVVIECETNHAIGTEFSWFN